MGNAFTLGIEKLVSLKFSQPIEPQPNVFSGAIVIKGGQRLAFLNAEVIFIKHRQEGTIDHSLNLNKYFLTVPAWTSFSYLQKTKCTLYKNLALKYTSCIFMLLASTQGNRSFSTSFKTNSRAEYLSGEMEIMEDSTINYHSFLFTIKNISDTLLYMGRTFAVFFLHREAKDRNGKWIKIDKKLSEVGLCLTGQPSITLQPKEIMVSKVRRCKGNLLTDFRLAFGHGEHVVYSNTYKDFIDERALNDQVAVH